MNPIQSPATSIVSIQRLQSVALGKLELKRNLAQIDKCINEYAEGVESVIAALKDSYQCFESSLQCLKCSLEQQINDAILEVDASLAQDSPVLTSPLAQGLRQYTPGKLTFFRYSLQLSEIQKLIPTMLAYSLADFSEAKSSLFSLSSTAIRLFDFATERWGQKTALVTEIKCDAGTQYTLLAPSTLLASGGGHFWSSAYEVAVSGAVTPLQNMLAARRWHGVVSLQQFLYVFGGMSDKGVTGQCEKLDLASKTWQEIARMNTPRCSIVPVAWQEAVYLFGGGHCNGEIEIFLPASQTFRLLAVALPEGDSTIAFLSDDGITVIGKRFITRFSRGGNSLAQVSTAEHPFYRHIWPNGAVALRSGRLYTVKEGGCLVYNAGSGFKVSEISA